MDHPAPARTRRFRRFGAAAILLGSLALAPLSPAQAAAGPAFRNGDGISVLSARQLDPRLIALTVSTGALPGPAAIRILLPSGYAGHPGTRYPVLYLLHGTSGGAADWTTQGDAEQITAGRPLIVVMPDIALNDDGGGWCTNWPDGAYRWETFHIDQLIPWVDANLRTIPTRGERAIAGLSQGGFCSMSYAARYPDLFGTALAYSGAPDIWYGPDARAGAIAVINATEVALDHVPPDSMFGSPLTDGINWAAHDPATLAGNLRWTRLFMYTGNGLPGPYDPAATVAAGSGIEALAAADNADFHGRLESLGIPSYYDPYGPGTHTWPYWERDLRWSIGTIMDDFAHPAPAPSQFTYTSADSSYAEYGWRVALHRAERGFSTLAARGSQGFSLADPGDGSATVVTPPDYRPGARYSVAVSGDRVAPRTLHLTAPPDGRLTISVPLGQRVTVQIS